MAGFMKRLNGYVYDGLHKAGEALPNGVFVEITANGVKKLTAAKTGLSMRVVKKTTLWGLPAVELMVLKNDAPNVFFVENEWDINDASEYNEAEYECKVNDFVKMHAPVINDMLVMTIADSLLTALNEGDLVNPAADGTIAKSA